MKQRNNKEDRLLLDSLWARLRVLARKRGRRAVAVPFVGTGAGKRLPLKRGDLLIVRFDDAAIKAGLTNPKEIVAFIRRGVDVHNMSNLHAKVYVMGGRAIVCSANVSALSENHLIEAGVEIANPAVVKRLQRFVEGLRGDVIELKFARSKVPLYRPPRFVFAGTLPRRRRGRRRQAAQSELVAIGLKWADPAPAEREALKRVRNEGRKRLSDRERFAIDDFYWHGRGTESFRIGQRVLPVFKGPGRAVVYPPARILAIRRYRVGTSRRVAVATEVRKRLRPRSLKSVISRLGPSAASLRRVNRRRLRDPVLVYRLGQLWRSAN